MGRSRGLWGDDGIPYCLDYEVEPEDWDEDEDDEDEDEDAVGR